MGPDVFHPNQARRNLPWLWGVLVCFRLLSCDLDHDARAPLARAALFVQDPEVSEEKSTRRLWTEDEIILGLYLYFQVPFGQLHSQNPEIQKLAVALGRSNNSVAMKLCNFASLDPKIKESGRKGLAGASTLDRIIYMKFSKNWNRLVAHSSELWKSQVEKAETEDANAGKDPAEFDSRFEPYQGASTKQSLTTLRVGQGFFRRAVLVNYEEKCCVTGLSEPRLLVASHIRPWGKDVENRHNPANGLLLSAIFDRAFDCGLIAIDQHRQITISRQLLESKNLETRDFFSPFEKSPLRAPIRFEPDPAFLEWHYNHCFLDR